MGTDLNPGTQEYKVGLLNTWLWSLMSNKVHLCKFVCMRLFHFLFLLLLLFVTTFLALSGPSSGGKEAQEMYKTKYYVENIKTWLQCVVGQYSEPECNHLTLHFHTKSDANQKFSFSILSVLQRRCYVGKFPKSIAAWMYRKLNLKVTSVRGERGDDARCSLPPKANVAPQCADSTTNCCEPHPFSVLYCHRGCQHPSLVITSRRDISLLFLCYLGPEHLWEQLLHVYRGS